MEKGATKMNQEQALKLLIEAVEIANKRGAYSLQESRQIADAVDAFTPKEQHNIKEQGPSDVQ